MKILMTKKDITESFFAVLNILKLGDSVCNEKGEAMVWLESQPDGHLDYHIEEDKFVELGINIHDDLGYPDHEEYEPYSMQ